MSKRCELQKEYFKEFGNYKGKGKYSDHYVNWLESRVLTDKDSNQRIIEELNNIDNRISNGEPINEVFNKRIEELKK